MKKTFIKLTASVLIAALALPLTACGSGAAEPEAAPVPEFVYSAETVGSYVSDRDNALAAEPGVMTPEGCYAIGGIIGEKQIPRGAKEEYEGQFDTVIPVISFAALDGTVTPLSGYAPIVPENTDPGLRDYRVNNSIYCLRLTREGNIALVENVYASWSTAPEDVKYGSEEYFAQLSSADEDWYRLLSPDGTELSRGLITLPDGVGRPDYGVCAADGENRLVCAAEGGLIAIAPEGGTAWQIPFDAYIYSIERLPDGKLCVLGYDYNDYACRIRLIDSENGCFEDKAYTPDTDCTGLLTGGEGDVYLLSGSTVSSYDFEDGTVTKQFSWVNCGLIDTDLACMGIGTDGSILAVRVEPDSVSERAEAQFIRIVKAPYDPAKEKRVLTFATLWMDDNTAKQIIDFNRTHSDVRIEVEDYSAYNTPDDYSGGETKLKTQIAAGDVPDILDFSNTSLPYRRFAASGLLLDLYPLLNSDSELSADDFFPNMLKAFEVNGGLYTACSGVGIYTLAGPASVTGDGQGLTFDGYLEALSRMPEGCEGMDPGMTKADILSITAALEMEDYLDWSTGECNFDSEGFISMLEYVNTFPGSFDYDSYEYVPEDEPRVRVSDGRQMLMMSVLTSVNFIMDDYDGIFGGDAVFTGFPTNHGTGNLLMPINSVAITSGCKEPEAAWEFVREFFDEDFQEKGSFIPTNRKVYERELEKAMKVTYKTDANGNFILDAEGERVPEPLGGYYSGSRFVEVYALTPRQADMMTEAIENTTRLLNFDESIDEILLRETEPYFNGDKTAEETAKLIQSKVSIYVNEHR